MLKLEAMTITSTKSTKQVIVY